MTEPGYVWYSFGSDTTGPALAQALGFDSGKKTPNPDKYGVIVGWGCKPGTTYKRSNFQKAITAGKLRVLNAVEAIEANRNKFSMFQRLAQRKVLTPGFVFAVPPANMLTLVTKALKEGVLAFPLVAQDNVHKAEPIFCYTEEDVKQAVGAKREVPIEYFRSYCQGTEYRIHVLRDTILFGQAKKLSGDPIQAYAEHLCKDLLKLREKDRALQGAIPAGALTTALVSTIVKKLAADMLVGPAQLQKSINKGWELTDVQLGEIPDFAKEAAVRALDAVELDMGAVSVSVEDKSCRITGIAAAPALSEEALRNYTRGIKGFVTQKNSKKAPLIAEVRGGEASPEMIARIAQNLRGLGDEKAKKILDILGS